MRRFQFLALLVFLFGSFVIYWGAWNGFFQQDEWLGLGNYFGLRDMALWEQLLNLYRPMFSFGLKHFLPVIPLANLVRYHFFGLDYKYYVFMSLLLHTGGAYLVFLLTRNISKNNRSGFLAGLFFLLNASGSEAVTWVAASTPTQLALLFSLLSLFFFIRWIDSHRSWDVVGSIATFLLAIFSKETSIFLFIAIPTFFLSSKKRDNSLKRNRFWLFFFLFLIIGYTLLRLFLSGTDWLLEKKTFLPALISLVPKSLSQILIPQEISLWGGREIYEIIRQIPIRYTVFPFRIESVMAGLLLFLNWGSFIFVLYWCLKFLKKSSGLLAKNIWLFIFCFFASLLPLLFIDKSELWSVVLPERGLYIPLALASVVFGLFFAKVAVNKRVLTILILLWTVNLVGIRTNLKLIVDSGRQRAEILKNIRNKFPKLQGKTVFFIESNSSYYGLPETEKILPFQSGLGQTLLVWYHDTENFPAEFFKNQFLWQIGSQGYQEFDGRGFGYYRNESDFLEFVNSTHLRGEQIIAFFWESETKNLIDISEAVRENVARLK